MRRRLGPLVLALALVPGAARAHGVPDSRFAAPLPLPLLFLGAGATVALTAAWLGVRVRSAPGRPERDIATLPGRWASALAGAARAGFGLAVAAAVLHGLLGPATPLENLATTFVWAAWLKGVGLLAILAGNPWRVLSPWEALYDLLARIEGREPALVDYPARLGAWPALVGFVVWIGILENLSSLPRSPRLTAALVAAYAFLMLAGGLAFGRPWFRHADALAALYRLFGRVAPLRVAPVDGGYAIRIRAPWRGCTGRLGTPGLAAFAVAVVYTVSFDGFANTIEYEYVLVLVGRASPGASGVAAYLSGLLLFVAAFLLVAALADRLGGRREATAAAHAFAPTVLPIAAAYEVAHNYPFVARGLARSVALAAEFLVGSVAPIEPLGWLSLPAFWGSQVVLIVLGHVVAVVAAHLVAVGRYETPRSARRGHLPLVLLMVGYTVLSLWIVSRPVVAG